MKLNERAWAGQIISWLKHSIVSGSTIFEDATNDEGLKLDSGKTKFPDILLFIDKSSGIVFNGWELKFPDTKVDDIEMLQNALEKAEKLKSNSFVTWNGAEAIIWLIKDETYTIESIERLKIYPKENGIDSRKDLEIRSNYLIHEPKLQKRLIEIIHDLEQLYKSGTLKSAINISDNIIEAVTQTANLIIPQLQKQIEDLKSNDNNFKSEFLKWKIIESSTLKILSSSSRKVEIVVPEQVLAKFTFYKIIGKILFYLTLSENLSGKINKLVLPNSKDIKKQINSFFNQAKKIDYQAVFDNDFTDQIEFNPVIDVLLFELINVFNEFDFKILPTEVIGSILENLVPKSEKQKFGQYFTPEKLAFLVTFSALRNKNSLVIDPTSGTGTFLNTFYKTFEFLGNKNHQQILNQIWGNDISHFPATLSVINLYKQKVNDIANFPRVTRKDFFNLQPSLTIEIPDAKDINKINKIPIPTFDAIISNFPFIQQEDIPNEILYKQFKAEFNKSQKAFLDGTTFKLNERADYYVYCFYNSLKFLNANGVISIITSNAWLGKNYGLQFKQFLLDNFHIKYIVKSNAEHWFEDSKVSTLFITLQKGKSSNPTKFISIKDKLQNLFPDDNLQRFEDFYAEIDNCNLPQNTSWLADTIYSNVFNKTDHSLTVSIVDNNILNSSIKTQENWNTYFIAPNPLSVFDTLLINPFPTIYKSGRGTRTGQDDLHIISNKENATLKIESKYLLPIIKSSQELESILHPHKTAYNLFICDDSLTQLKATAPNAYKWIKKFETATNKKGVSLQTVLGKRKPYWYTLKPETPANIFISINPSNKLFFSYTTKSVYTNQRLALMRVTAAEAPFITALLNSIVSLLIVELNGVSRNLGALDLNADFFKTKMKILNPALFSNADRKKILSNFDILSKRKVLDYTQEYKLKDRIEFDKSILKALKINDSILPQLYDLLVTTISNRVEMKNR